MPPTCFNKLTNNLHVVSLIQIKLPADRQPPFPFSYARRHHDKRPAGQFRSNACHVQSISLDRCDGGGWRSSACAERVTSCSAQMVQDGSGTLGTRLSHRWRRESF